VKAPVPSPADIRAAAVRIASATVRTPLRHSAALSALVGGDVYLKLENEQVTGSFKSRGAHNALAMFSANARARGAVASSAGNHGLGVAHAAHTLGIRATIFVPSTAPRVKRDGIAALGATVNAEAADYDAAMVLAREFAQSSGATFVHPCLGDDLLAGQGTVALEIAEQLPSVATIVTCVGGGGLLGGMAGFLRSERPDVRIIGAQTERTNAMAAALTAGHLVEIPSLPTLADGLAGQIDDAAFAIGRYGLDEMTVISEDDTARAIRWLWENEHIKAEGSGAVAVGALLSSPPHDLRFPIVAVISGANIDEERFEHLLQSAPSAPSAPPASSA
jgi:threonine dehydratase